MGEGHGEDLPDLGRRAAEVLRRNDMGGWTTTAPSLYPLARVGEAELAGSLRDAALEALCEGGFAEYFEPFTGEALCSHDQSWTAAVALDWLGAGKIP